MIEVENKCKKCIHACSMGTSGSHEAIYCSALNTYLTDQLHICDGILPNVEFKEGWHVRQVAMFMSIDGGKEHPVLSDGFRFLYTWVDIETGDWLAVKYAKIKTGLSGEVIYYIEKLKVLDINR